MVNPQLQAFADAVNAKFDSMGTDTDSLTASLTGISGDVAFLKDTIAQLQNSPGTFSPEDQLLVDAIQTRVNGLADKVATAATTGAALDAATESAPTPGPIVPPPPGT